MKLDENTNYIVSGLERSGTSMLMQILNAAHIPIESDHSSRPADKSNPKGYYELEGGKIINRLMDEKLSLNEFKGKFIKITAYGMKFLPENNYKIIYSERDIEEILDSMEKMAGVKDENRDVTRKAFIGLNKMVKQKLKQRTDVDVLFVNYNDILAHPRENLKKIQKFLNLSEENLNKMVVVVDKRLYRQRRK